MDDGDWQSQWEGTQWDTNDQYRGRKTAVAFGRDTRSAVHNSPFATNNSSRARFHSRNIIFAFLRRSQWTDDTSDGYLCGRTESRCLWDFVGRKPTKTFGDLDGKVHLFLEGRRCTTDGRRSHTRLLHLHLSRRRWRSCRCLHHVRGWSCSAGRSRWSRLEHGRGRRRSRTSRSSSRSSSRSRRRSRTKPSTTRGRGWGAVWRKWHDREGEETFSLCE